MTRSDLVLTGFASISARGVVLGTTSLQAWPGLQPLTRWRTAGSRHACLVPTFRTDQFVPGLRTRRLDRLSVWAMLGGALALQDAALIPRGPDAPDSGSPRVLTYPSLRAMVRHFREDSAQIDELRRRASHDPSDATSVP